MRLKQITVGVALTASSLATAATAYGQITATKDSAGFDLQINGETAPASVFGPVIWTTDTVDLLTFRPNGLTGGMAAAGGAFGWNNVTSNAAGYTTEFRFRIDELPDQTPGSPFVISLIASDGEANQYNVLGITQNRVYRNTASFTDSGVTHPVDADIVAEQDFFDGAFHTIRVAEAAGSADTSLWIDGTLITTEFLGNNFTLKRVWLGDVGGGVVDGQVSIDYFRLDTTGGFAPIPEPGSLAVLAAGSLGLLRRRRR